MFSAVIFDMDGVLVDSEPVWREVECEYYLRNYGLSLQREDFDPFTGMPVTIFLRKLHQRHALPEDNLRQVHDTIVEEVARRIRLKPAPLPGVYELLNHLHQHNIPLAVASSSPQRPEYAPLFLCRDFCRRAGAWQTASGDFSHRRIDDRSRARILPGD